MTSHLKSATAYVAHGAGALLLLITLLTAVSLPQDATTEGFDITVTYNEDENISTALCASGCAWTQLEWTCDVAEEEPCEARFTERGIVPSGE
ncbi:MAG: hypothetical protein GVY12_11940 [Bacteroidetes bacterium]|jgi:imidazole glycerol phosphate synthase subunit HisF|nr:hypothetical protein [Bacteroidota bacterium]